MYEPHLLEVARQRLLQFAREHGHAILLTLAIANRKLRVTEIYVFDPQAQAFHQAQPGTALLQKSIAPMLEVPLRRRATAEFSSAF